MDNSGFGCSLVEPQYSISALGHLTGVKDYNIIWKLTGWEEKGELCGKVIAIESCKEHPENSKIINHKCTNPKCSFCYESWIGRQVKKSEERLLIAKSLYDDLDHKLGNIKHIIVSPPQTDAIKEMTKTSKDYKKLKKTCIDYLNRIGSKGGVLIFHRWRITKEYQIKFAKYKKGGGDGALWDWVRAEGLLNEAVYISPHFHTLQYGYLKDSDLAYQDFIFNNRTNRFDGWIYSNIEPDVEGGRDIKRTLAYQLNHCSLAYHNIYERRSIEVVTYYGMLSNNKIVKDEEKSYFEIDEPICKDCNEPIHKFVDKENDSIYLPDHVLENPETLFIFCNLYDCGEVKRKILIDVYEIKRGSWYYRWRKKKRKVKEDGTVIHDGMILENFIPTL